MTFGSCSFLKSTFLNPKLDLNSCGRAGWEIDVGREYCEPVFTAGFDHEPNRRRLVIAYLDVLGVLFLQLHMAEAQMCRLQAQHVLDNYPSSHWAQAARVIGKVHPLDHLMMMVLMSPCVTETTRCEKDELFCSCRFNATILLRVGKAVNQCR